MNFIKEERGCSDREEQEEDEEEVVMTSKLPLSSPSSSSSSTRNRSFLTQPQSLWLADSFESQQDHNNQESHLNFDKKLELVDLSLGSANEADNSTGGAGAGAGASTGPIEREHMFDKVVTPSDVGKLNRLVIPKQHAEKYFPLDSSSNEKGLLLNFEDPTGKLWRFRYSYWNSSQSYVMTKGWSRFVKDKKLDAGDIVSFQRGVGLAGNNRLFIEWRRRPNAPDPTSLTHLDVQNRLQFPQSVRWDRLYSLPQTLSMPRQYHLHQQQQQTQFQQLNYGIHQPYHHHHHHHHSQHQYHYHQPTTSNYAYASHYYLRQQEAYPIGSFHQQGVVDHAPVVIDSVPVVHGKTAGKRLRLFGVNMDCPTTTQEEPSSPLLPLPHGGTVGPFSPHLASSSLPLVQLRVADDTPIPTFQAEFSKKGKTSLSLDLDI